jgi:hypothetical protein
VGISVLLAGGALVLAIIEGVLTKRWLIPAAIILLALIHLLPLAGI